MTTSVKYYIRVASARDKLRKLKAQAGPALENWEHVNGQLSEATDFFSESNWADATLDEIAQAGGRIQRKASQLVAAARVPAAVEALAEAQAELDKARASR
jgi:hypothetical protein